MPLLLDLGVYELRVHNLFPEIFVLVSHWFHQRLNKVRSWLHSQNGKDATFGLYPDGLLAGMRIYSSRIKTLIVKTIFVLASNVRKPVR